MAAYDLLVGSNHDVVARYLSNIQDILANFCTQADARILKANGKIYTDVKAQGIMPIIENFLNMSFAIAGSNTKVVGFIYIKGLKQ